MFKMSRFNSCLSDFLCFWFCIIGLFANCQIIFPLKGSESSSTTYDCTGVETFEKVSGVELTAADRIPLYSSTNGAITADCYNRCRSSSSCSAFWIDYDTTECFRLAQLKFPGKKIEQNFSRASAYFERTCLLGDVCSKAWISERIPGYELMGHDDVIIRSVVSRKRCTELCLTDKRLPCRSADFWENRKECRLSREDRRSQPGAFVKSSSEVEYIENACTGPTTGNRRKDCEWEVLEGVEFKIFDFTTRSSSLIECQKTCESYTAFICRSVTFDNDTGICLLSGSDVATTANKLLRTKEGKVYAQRILCVDMSLECLSNSIVAKLKSQSPFYGKMFSMPPSSDCEVFGHGKSITIIEFPLSSCGIQKNVDGSFVGTLVVQQHPLIQKRGDSAFRLVCSFPETNRTLSHIFGFDSEYPRFADTSVSATALPAPVLGIGSSIVVNSTAKSPTVTLRILDVNGNDVTGVSLGDELFLKVQVDDGSAYGLLVRDLVAKSGTNQEELVLLDSRGCPEDPSIFPYLKKESYNSKSLKSRFEAFKFTNDAVVRFQVHLQFCRQECPAVKCDGELSYGKKKRTTIELGNPKVIELGREIIVFSTSSQRMKNNQRKNSISIHDEFNENGHNAVKENEICGSKHLFIGLITGFSVTQLTIVFCTVVYICRKSQKLRHQSNYIQH